jgi:Zn-dependent protease with chaperone function
MQTPGRFLLFLSVLLLVAAFGLFLPARAHSQTPPASQPEDSDPDAAVDNDDDKPVSFLAVSITLDPSGKATAQANYLLDDERSLPPAEIKEALESALNCSLENSPRVRPMPGNYSGSCTAPTSAQRFLHEGRISTASLQEFARLHNITSSALQLHLPDSDILETLPPIPRNSATPAKTPASLIRFMRAFFLYEWSPEKPLPAEITYRYGYASSTLQRNAAILLFVLLSPLALFVWLGRRALSADVTDKAVVWFTYMRSLQWILNFSLFGWWIALDYCHTEPILRFFASGTRFAALAAHPVLYESIAWIPPAILWLLCYRISHPVQQKLRGLRWTKRELTLQALYSVLARLIPFAMFLTGLRVIGTGGFRSALLWWVAAFLLRAVAAQALLKLTGMQPQALSSGDLRDRAFAMAERIGVKLQQVYLIPSGKGQVANAFARTGNTISFTDYLLERMSQREVDYVMAHELSHLKLKHPAKLGYAYMGSFFLAMFAVNFLAPFFHDSVVTRYALIFAIVSAFPYFWSRRFEYAADAGAVAATGDPRAAISALFKLSELNMMPIHWSHWREKWLTHPSSMRRAQAVAKKAAIPFEEIPTIARDGAAEAVNYAIPSTTGPGAKLHSTQRTRSVTLRLSFVLVGLLAFVPSLFSLVAIYLSSPAKWLVFALALPVTLLAFLLLANYSPRFIRGNLLPALNKKLAAQGIQADSWSGVYVGFSPTAAPRLYEGNSNWDIGYLFFRSDRICYRGEETRFALRQDQITAIKHADGLPGLLSTNRIYIAWSDAERGTCGVFNISCGHVDSILHAKKLNVDLAHRLQAWWKSSPVTRPLPPQLAGLASPELRTVTSTNPASQWKRKKLFSELLWTAIFSGVGASLCTLPFHFLPYLFSASYSRMGIANPFHTPGAGWYAVFVAVTVRFITIVPLLRYRDLPKLIAQAPTYQHAYAPVSARSEARLESLVGPPSNLSS